MHCLLQHSPHLRSSCWPAAALVAAEPSLCAQIGASLVVFARPFSWAYLVGLALMGSGLGLYQVQAASVSQLTLLRQ